MQVNVSKNTLKKVIVFCIVLLLIVIAVVGKEFLSCRGCKATFGTITDTRMEIDTYPAGSHTGRSNRNHYYTCKYTDGVGTHYVEYFSWIPRKKGKKVLVFYSSDAPNKTVNNAVLEIGGLATSIILLFMLFCIKGLTLEKDGVKKQSKQKDATK